MKSGLERSLAGRLAECPLNESPRLSPALEHSRQYRKVLSIHQLLMDFDFHPRRPHLDYLRQSFGMRDRRPVTCQSSAEPEPGYQRYKDLPSLTLSGRQFLDRPETLQGELLLRCLAIIEELVDQWSNLTFPTRYKEVFVQVFSHKEAMPN